MAKVVKSSRQRKGRAPLPPSPLFEHAERARVRSLAYGPRWIARTRGVSAPTALEIARAAGIRLGDDE